MKAITLLGMSRVLATFACLLVAAMSYAQGAGSHAAPPPTERAIEFMQQGADFMRGGQAEQAATAFQQATVASPRFAEAFLNLGLADSQLGRSEEAAAALQKAVALKPALRGAHLFLAISQYRAGQLEPASVSIRKETALNAADAQAWMWQGIIDLSLTRLTAAVEDLDKASSLAPGNLDILYHRGRAALALSRASYEEMYKLDPNSWHVHQVLAQADVESDHDADAVEQYKLAIASAPVQGGLYEALGSSLWRTGKFQEAEEAFEAALKADPDDILTMYKLGCLRVDRGNAAGGKPLLDKVIVADSTLKLASYYLGRAESELGQDAQAVTDFKKVIAENVDPDTTKQAWFQLSRVYRRLHDNASAAQAQAEYRRLDQLNRDALQDKLAQRRLRADRDTSIPAPAAAPSGSETP